MVGMIFDIIGNNLGESVASWGYKSHMVNFDQHLMFWELDEDLDSSIRYGILNLG